MNMQKHSRKQFCALASDQLVIPRMQGAPPSIRATAMHKPLSGGLLLLAALLAVCLSQASSQGLPVQYGLLPLGDLTTNDQGGPYLIPAVQAAEVEAAIASKTGIPTGPYTDADLINFLVSSECLEAIFYNWAAFGQDVPPSLKPGPVTGVRRAQLSNQVQPWAEELALVELGHVKVAHQMLSNASVSCPPLDVEGGFVAFMDAAANQTSSPPFDPFANDVNFLLSVLALEDVGSQGEKGAILLASNPGIANVIAGLASVASYQNGVTRHMLWERRNQSVAGYANMSVADMVAAITSYQDALDGPNVVGQGLTNTNPNFIRVPTGNINLVPTDLRGLTFSRTPQQVLRIFTLGSEDGRGAWFPQGFNGRLNSTVGYNISANGRGGYPGNNVQVVTLAAAGRSQLLGNQTLPLPAPEGPAQDKAENSGELYGAAFLQPPGEDHSAIYSAGQPAPVEERGAVNSTNNATSAANNMAGDMGAANTTSNSTGAEATNATNLSAANSTGAGADNATAAIPTNSTGGGDNSTEVASTAVTSNTTAAPSADSIAGNSSVPASPTASNQGYYDVNTTTLLPPAVTDAAAAASNATASGTGNATQNATAAVQSSRAAAAALNSLLAAADGGAGGASAPAGGNGAAPPAFAARRLMRGGVMRMVA